MLCKTYSSFCLGMEALTVTVEVDVSQGISFYMVGLPDSAVRESQQRISTALHTIGCRIPGKRITINLAPADIRKEGSSFDLAIAIGIVAASEQHYFAGLQNCLIMGELALDGSLRAVPGALPITIQARKMGFKWCLLPVESAYEAAVVEGIEVYGLKNLREVISLLLGEGGFEPLKSQSYTDVQENRSKMAIPDFFEVKGQESAKRALEIAAAGSHNILMIGPPGSGKSLLAKAVAGILPPMAKEESMQTSIIYSVAGRGGPLKGLIKERPFRSPHHSCSSCAITGGGQFAVPGEISLAHNGVLYLDELPEFPRPLLELLRQPLEDREISISRLKHKFTYPCNFMLIASMNPCPCGFHGQPGDRCTCTPYSINRYLSRISGPLLDRIDMQIEVNPPPVDRLLSEKASEESGAVRKRVTAAREAQIKRFEGKITTNSQMGPSEIKKFCSIGHNEQQLLRSAIEKLKLSARGYSRILKVARTIADLESSDTITLSHIAEAIQFRGVLRS